MKQGRASVSNQNGAKVEPKPRSVSPCAVDQLGNHLGNPQAVEAIYNGKGYKTSKVPTMGKGNQGPGAHRTVHRSGSQSHR
jgi:hypothetical protein